MMQQTRLGLCVFAFQLFLLLLVSVPAWRQSGSTKLTGRATVGVLMLLAGVVLLSRQGSFPDLITRVLAPWLLLGGLRTTYGAAYEICDVPAPPRWERWVSVLGAAALPVFFLADNSPDQLALARVRFMMIAIPSGTITACWLQRLWTGARRPWPLGTRYLFAAAMFAAIMHLGRVVAVWSMHGPLDPLLTPVAPVAVLGMLPTSVLMAFGLILQVEARARNRLIVANVQLAHDVETDALTGLGNRRRLENAAVRELSRARRYSWPVTVMLLDLDHFKNINDQWGHHAGDAVLCEVAARCLRILRSHDVLVRWGGEEFAVLLPQCDLATSEGIAERILEAMREQPLEAIHGERLTVSIGLAAVEPAEPTIEAALKRADAALYRAKHAGRNRHAVAGTESVWEDSETNLSSLSPARRRSAS